MRVQRIENIAGKQKVLVIVAAVPMPANQAPLPDEVAGDASDVEVIAALTDPIIMGMQKRGLIN